MITTVPVVAIRGSVVFPNTDSILSFGRPKSVAAINAAFAENRVVAIFAQRDANTTDPEIDELEKIGTIATITQMMSTEGEIHAMVHGQARITIEESVAHEPYLIAKVKELTEEKQTDDEIVALARQLTDLFRKAINLGKSVEITTVMRIVSGQAEPSEVVDSVASLLDIKARDKQKLL